MDFSRNNWRDLGLADLPNEEVLARFEQGIARGTSSGPYTLGCRIRAALHRQEVATGAEPHLLDCVSNPELLAEVLRRDELLGSPGRRISRRTVQGTINAFRAFTAWVPLPDGISCDSVRGVVASAVAAISVRRGLRRHVAVGETRRADRRAPTAEEIQRLIAELRADPHPLADVASDLIGACYLTGVRVGALLALRRRDLVLEGGQWCFVVNEKARPDRRLVLVALPDRQLLTTWLALPDDAPLWGHRDRVLDYPLAARLFRRAVAAAGLPSDTDLHSLRHAFATDLAAVGGLGLTMRAGGWLGEGVAQGYVHQR